MSKVEVTQGAHFKVIFLTQNHLVQSVTATRKNQEGGKWRLELTGLVRGRRRTSNAPCRNLSDFFSQLLLTKDLDSVVRPAEIVAKVPFGNVVST